MKALLVAVFLAFAAPGFAAPETKRVCVEQVDPKTKKPTQVCRDIRVHKKLDGTPVPPKK